MKIHKDDEVIVISGRDKGKRGKVLHVIPADNRVVVQGINMVKRHTKPAAGQTGGIVEKEVPIHASNIALLDPKDEKPTRIGFKLIDGRKVRFARRSGEIIDR
ncbi:MAG: 50S ribosomal protein L24 [Proteobacteria bacterium]|nr:50S ribosomal protein L24 [Pseudomonadota bacterium]